MHENSIAGLQRPIGKLLVIGLAGLMDGEGIQTKGLTETDLLDGLPDAEWTLLEGCSHLAQVEAPAAYRSAVQGFLDQLAER